MTQLADLTKLIQRPLTPQKRLALVALITQDVHYRDVIDLLLKKAL